MSKTKLQYVDNQEFFEAMRERIALVKAAKENGEPLPRVSEYIGSCIFKIATNFANLKSFSRYPFKEDMILDAAENCIRVIDNFDETKTQNPFSYFTQITYYAFLRRIAKEKRQLFIKSKLLTSSALDIYELQEHDESEEFVNNYIEYMKAYNNFDGSSFEKKSRDKITKKQPSGLEVFCNESSPETQVSIIPDNDKVVTNP